MPIPFFPLAVVCRTSTRESSPRALPNRTTAVLPAPRAFVCAPTAFARSSAVFDWKPTATPYPGSTFPPAPAETWSPMATPDGEALDLLPIAIVELRPKPKVLFITVVFRPLAMPFPADADAGVPTETESTPTAVLVAFPRRTDRLPFRVFAAPVLARPRNFPRATRLMAGCHGAGAALEITGRDFMGRTFSAK